MANLQDSRPSRREQGFAASIPTYQTATHPTGASDRPAYTFQFDLSTGRTTYRTPALPGVDNTTIIDQDGDRHVRAITLPGARNIGTLVASYTYDALFGAPTVSKRVEEAVERNEGNIKNFVEPGLHHAALEAAGKLNPVMEASNTAHALTAPLAIGLDVVTQDTPIGVQGKPDLHNKNVKPQENAFSWYYHLVFP